MRRRTCLFLKEGDLNRHSVFITSQTANNFQCRAKSPGERASVPPMHEAVGGERKLFRSPCGGTFETCLHIHPQASSSNCTYATQVASDGACPGVSASRPCA